MAINEEKRLLTIEEFEQIADSPENADRILELINGEIVEKVGTEEHSYIQSLFARLLGNFADAHQLGIVLTEPRYRKPDDVRNSLLPDVAFRSLNRPLNKKGSIPELPDLAIEVKSPEQSLRTLRNKVRYYITHGVKLVWLVNPEAQVVEVYTLEDEVTLGMNDVLTGGDVLPGFTLLVRDIFADPFTRTHI